VANGNRVEEDFRAEQHQAKRAPVETLKILKKGRLQKPRTNKDIRKIETLLK
jgi:hypothetical protein